MKVLFHRSFEKKYKQIPVKIRNQFNERLFIFISEPFNKQLNNHGLRGKYKGCRSINITGDLRAIFEVLDEDSVRFIDIDTHGNLYK